MRSTVVFALSLLLIIALPEASAQLSCGVGKVGDLVCRDPEINDLMKDVTHAIEKEKCDGRQKAELGVVMQAWGWQQYACEPSDDVKRCLVLGLKKEREYFNSVARCDDPPPPQKFDAIDPSYVHAHPQIYVESNVRLFGRMFLQSCEIGSQSLRGSIYSPSTRARFKVVFGSLSEEQRRFICKAEPLSFWAGVVKVSSKEGVYMLAADVLGDPLP